MKIIEAGAREALQEVAAGRRLVLEQYEDEVRPILAAVRTEGDAALCRFTARFDGVELEPSRLRVTEEEVRQACERVDEGFLAALLEAKKNIETYQRARLPRGGLEVVGAGNLVGHLVRPLSRVGIYVPGGTAAYPSSVLMNALPARVAGVREVAMVTPPAPDGSVNPYTLVAAAEAGVTEIYRVGGAQAVAALAYGTETVPAVNKITGPGNAYVAAAKRLVYGRVDIDMVAGPSEIVVIADGSAPAAYVAADLLSQAEHDARALAVLLTPEPDLARAVAREVEVQLAELPREAIARRAVEENGWLMVTADLEEALELANLLAPEHLELLVAEPWRWLDRVQNAGAVFLGPYSPEPVGDYWAGPNHVLPTGGAARYASALGVEDFVKRISVIGYSAAGLAQAGPGIVRLAEAEGLGAHARAVRKRLEGGDRWNAGPR
ncbi:MAG: histidinol dehydrogenase [Clostridia bacterium]|jgi:histidinol dehydrogenase|nr:histidinol dehydrogenase [Clostridia bacterium]MDH7573665.1 histidinol dehydrogenase [Clostridia bacterium]